MKTLSIVIPVYNERDTIKEIIKRVEDVRLDGFRKEIILVDDGSTDGTRKILKNLDVKSYRIFFQEKNLGKGAAVRRGFGEATGDVVLIQDADLEYDPGDYPKLVSPIVEGKSDVVYGSRFLNQAFGSRIVYRRGYLANRILNRLSNFLSGLKLSDMYTCYKVFSREALLGIRHRLKSNRFGIDPEITAMVSKNELRICEIPIGYKGRTYQEGKKINWKDGLAAVWHIIRSNIFT